MSALRQLVRRGMSAALPRDRFMVRGRSRGVALTFDDGPHPDITPRLLDLLAAQQLRATFFVVGAAVEKHPELIRRMAREGHAIGHHSWTHSEPSTTTAATLLAEVTRCRALLGELTGKSIDRFRPPKGQLTAAKMLGLLRLRQRVVLWSLDPKDYQMTSDSELVAWGSNANFQNGEIVLLHDVKPHCLTALPIIAARVAACGQQLVTLDAWLPAERLLT